MIARLILVLSVAGICSFAEAQNCHGSISYSSPCADSTASYKTATSLCKSTLRVYAGSATSTCQSAGALAANIAGQCASQCVAPPPPQPIYLAGSFRGAAISYEPVPDKPNFVKVTWVNYEKDYYTCSIKKTNKYIAVLDKTNAKNAAYFASNPAANSTKYLYVYMACSTSTTSVKTYDSAYNPTTTYASGCYVYSYSNSTDPSYCRSMYYYQY